MLVAHENGAVNVAIAVINLKLVYLYITIFTSLIAMLYGLPIGTTVYQLHSISVFCFVWKNYKSKILSKGKHNYVYISFIL